MTCAIAVAAAIAATGCGGDDGDGDGGGEEHAAPPPVRCTPAAGGAREVRVRPRWKAGDERTLTIEKVAEQGHVQPRRSTSTARLRVLASGGGRSTLRLTLDDVAFALGSSVPPELVERLKGESEGLTLEYTTDADGAFDRVRNVAQVREQLGRMLEVLEEVTGTDPRAQAVVRQTRALVESETFIQTTAGEEARLLHAAYGLDLAPGEAASGERELANPFGGEPLPATSRIELASPLDRNGCALLSGTVDADSDALVRTLEDFFSRFGQGRPDAAQIREARLRHATRFAYDPGSGWVVRAELTETISVGGQGRVDRTVVTNR